MSGRPLVSVGLPFHAARATLGDAIRSVFAQTFTDWELVLLDDGSTDGSLDLARSVRDPRVRVVTDGRRRHLAHRLNQMTDLARGEFIARMDADDLMHPLRLAEQVDRLRAGGVDVVGTGAYLLFGDELLGLAPVGPPPTDALGVLRRGLVPHATVLASRAWFRAHPYDESFHRAEDRELWCRAFRTTRAALVEAPRYFIRLGVNDRAVLRNYIRACRENCRVGWKHRAKVGGMRPMLSYAATVLAKAEVYRWATIFGQQARLLRRRALPGSSTEMEEGRRALAAMRGTAVPGLENG